MSLSLIAGTSALQLVDHKQFTVSERSVGSILHDGIVESIDAIVDGPWCGVVLRSLQKELEEASMYQPGTRRRERTWVWHTSPDTWIFYRMDLNETDTCTLAALTDLANGPAVPAR